MKKLWKRCLLLGTALSLIMAVGVFWCIFGAKTADAGTVVTGTCGDSISWTLDLNSGLLTLSGEGVMDDAESASETPFYQYSDVVTTVVVEEGITSISDYSFYNFPKLTGVSLPDTLTEIGSYAFSFDLLLEEIELPENLETIGNGAFMACHALTVFFVPESVTEIGSYAIGYYLKSGISGLYTVQSGMRMFGAEGSAAEDYADTCGITFVAVEGNTASGTCGTDVAWTLDFETGLLMLDGTGATSNYSSVSSVPFYYYASLITSIDVSEGITSVGNYLFASLTKVTSVSLPSTLTSIGTYSFQNCRSLKTLFIPASVTSIKSTAFRGCNTLEAFEVDEDNTSFCSCDGIIYNKNVTTIYFYPMNHPAEVYEIPATVTNMGNGLSYAQNLRCVIVPDSVTVSSAGIFSYIYSLEKIIFLGNATYTTASKTTYTNFSFTHDVTIVCDLSSDSWTGLTAASTYGDYITWLDRGDAEEGSLTISRESDIVATGSSMQLSAWINPSLAVLFRWASSDESVARVNSDGTLFGVSAGTAKITCTSEDGAYTASFTVTVTGESELSKVPDYVLTELDSSMVGTPFTSMQFTSESLGGIYFLNKNILYFYSPASDTYEAVRHFDGYVSVYEEGGLLYVMTSSSTYLVYDLETQSVIRRFRVETGYTGTAIGADASGRIYIAAYSSSNSIDNRVFLYTEDGELLSSAAVPTKTYEFAGFDVDSGIFFMESFYDYYSWGYSHDGRGVTVGMVTNNEISRVDTTSSFVESSVIQRSLSCLLYLHQDYYYRHQGAASLVGGHYLVMRSYTNGILVVDKVGMNSVTTLMTLSRSSIEYELSSTTIDTTSVGVRAVYNERNDSIVLYDNERTITEYIPDTGEAIAAYTTQYYVYSMEWLGDQLVIIEKEDGVYYLELVDWTEPEGISLSGGKDTMQVGESLQLTASSDAEYSIYCSWSSSDSQIASVTENGRVVAWSEGTVTITASILNGKYTASYTITVTASDVITPEEAGTAVDGTVSDNISDNNYSTYYARTVKSYLTENEDGTLTRVEYISGTGVLVETWTSDHELKDSMVIEPELSIFGGFYAGEDAYFLVYGQSNMDESDSVEVMRVVKYDKSWNRISQRSIYGANTYIPFDAGSLRMTETAGKLYIHTCHEMYDDGDGLHHQANMTFVIDEETMETVDSYYNVLNIAQAGYVSHSFNQYIQTDGTYVYRVDQGDGSPRAVAITKASVDGDITDVTYRYALTIRGSTGANATGVSVGGFEVSTDNLLIVGNSVDQSSSGTYSAYGQRNIFLTVTDKELTGTTLIWLTEYTSDESITPRTPQLVKLSEDHFLIMWEEYDGDSKDVTVKALTVDGDGNITSDVITVDVRLSDCQPIVTSDGLVTWYVTDGSSMVLYTLSPYDLFAALDMTLSAENTEEGILLTWPASGGVSVYQVYRKSGDGNLTLVAQTEDAFWEDTDTESGTSYTHQVVAVSKKGKEVKSGELAITRLSAPVVQSMANVSPGIELTWSTVEGAEEYCIYYGDVDDSSYKTYTVTAETGSTQSCIVYPLTVSTTYEMYVVAVAGEDESAVSNSTTLLYLRTTSVSLTMEASDILIGWSTIQAAEGYYIYRSVDGADYELLGKTEDTTWTDDDVEAGVTYSYQVYSYAGDTISDGSLARTIVFLAAPEIVEIGNSSYGITVTWAAVEGAERYFISYRAADAESYTTKSVTAQDTDTQSTTFSAISGTVYELYVRAYAGIYYSVASDTASYLYLSRTTVTLKTETSDILISWTEVTGAESYRIWRKAGDSELTLLADVEGTTYTDTQVESGVTYTYYVYAYADEILSAPSSARMIAFLDRPVVTGISNTSSGIKLEWNSVDGAEAYYVYLKALSSDTWTSRKVTPGEDETQSYTYAGASGTEYEFYVEAYVNGYYSVASDTLTMLRMTSPSLTVTLESGAAQLSWGTVSGAEGYYIYRSEDGGEYVLLETVEDTTFLDESLEDGVTYTYQVCGYSGDYLGVLSTGKSVTRLATPTIISGYAMLTGYMSLSWETVAGAESYYVYYKSASASNYTYFTVDAGSGSTKSTTYSCSTNGRSYMFYVKAYANGCFSDASEVKTITYLTAPTVSASQSAYGFNISWTANSYADGYYVYRKVITSDGSGAYELVATVTGTSWEDTDIAETNAYMYAVSAYSGISEGVLSTATSISKYPVWACTVELEYTSVAYDGTAKTPEVTVKNGSNVLSSKYYIVTYSYNTVPGTATVTVTGLWDLGGTMQLNFEIQKGTQQIEATMEPAVIQPDGTAQIYVENATGTITYSSSDTGVATVDENGLVTGTGVGNASITIHASGNEYYEAAEFVLEITVREANVVYLEDTDIYVIRTDNENGNVDASTVEELAAGRSTEQLIFSKTTSFDRSLELVLDEIEETLGVTIEGDKALLLQTDSTGALTLADEAMIANNTVTFSVTTGADSVVVYGYNGDVTGDGAVNASDTLAILRGVSGRTSLDEVEKGFADVNLDGSVNSNDLLAVVKYVSGRTSSLN